MPSPDAERITQLRLRAEEVRTIGEAMQSPEARRMLLGIADNYDRLADYVETPRQGRQRKDAS